MSFRNSRKDNLMAKRSPTQQEPARSIEQEPDGPTMRDVPDEEVAQRAYEIFMMRGGEHGHDIDDWIKAKQELAQREPTHPEPTQPEPELTHQ
jgi:hypothetical protein